MPILFRAALKREDYNQATSLHQKANPDPTGIVLGIFVIVLIITLGVGIVLNQSRAIPVLTYLLLLAISIYFFLQSTNVSITETWEMSTNLHDPYEGRISTQGIETRSPTYVSLLKWEHFKYYILTDNMILLYMTPLQSFILPQHYITTVEDWNRVIQEVQTRISSTYPTEWQRKSTVQSATTGFLFVTVLIIGIAVVFSF